MYKIIIVDDNAIYYTEMYKDYEYVKNLYNSYLRFNNKIKIYLVELKISEFNELEYYKILKTNV